MKTIFDKETRDALIIRIGSLTQNNNAQWGSMNVCQMIKHCIAWEEMFTGKHQLKQDFIGKLFGKVALRGMTGSDEPVKHDMPTLPQLKITDSACDIEVEKRKWMAILEENALHPNPNFVHSFFGKMTVEQTGILAYKHTDHHLRQFNS